MVFLPELGFDAHFVSHWRVHARSDRRPGRVVQEQKGAYRVLVAAGPESEAVAVWASIAGRLGHQSESRAELPAVGDFVVVEGGGDGRVRIAALLPRRTCLMRKAPGGESVNQVIAANVDTVFIMTSLNHDLNERRLERYLMAVWDGGALPVVVLSKSDLAIEQREELVSRVRSVAQGSPLHCVSVANGEGLDSLRTYFSVGKSVALVGSSGVGKSTLTNALLGEDVQSVKDVRESDDRGRHTTTSRTLLMVPGGGVILDTPGMREFMPSDEGQGIATVFEDLETLAARCRFTDCRHEAEPGCAIQAGILDGKLDAARLASYRKMQREQAWLERRQDGRLASVEKKKWKRIHMAMRNHPKKNR